jgi:hypothetical protein
MAQFTRFVQKEFGDLVGAAGNFGIFGSLAAGTPQYSKDPKVIQSLDAWRLAWAAATVGTKSPALEDMNSLFYLAFYQLGYLMQQGIPEWNADTTYYQNQYASSGGLIYKSLVNGNTEPVSNTNNWIEYVASVITPYLPSPLTQAKAWVTFNGRGAISADCEIYDSYNVQSVTKGGTGQYLVTFNTSFANAHYSWSGACAALNGNPSVNGDNNVLTGSGPVGSFPFKTTGAMRVCSWEAGVGGGLEDTSVITVNFFGRQ